MLVAPFVDQCPEVPLMEVKYLGTSVNLQEVVSTSIMIWLLYTCQSPIGVVPVHKPGGTWSLSSDKVFKTQLLLVARSPIVVSSVPRRYTL